MPKGSDGTFRLSNQTNHAKGLALTAIGGMALTFDIPLVKLSAGSDWSVLMMRSAMTLIAALLIWVVWRWMKGETPELVPGRKGLVVAALYGLSSVTFVLAVYNTTTANLAFIMAFNPMFAALLSWIFLGERPRPETFLAMAAMFGGILIIVGDSVGTGHLVGDFLALMSALVIAAAITLSRTSGRDMGFTALVGAMLPFVLAAIIVGGDGYRIDAPWWVIFNGAVIMPVSFFCLAAGPRYISAPEVAMFYLLETVLAPVWVWLIFSETPSRNSLIGGTILVAALVAHSLWQLWRVRNLRSDTAPAIAG